MPPELFTIIFDHFATFVQALIALVLTQGVRAMWEFNSELKGLRATASAHDKSLSAILQWQKDHDKHDELWERRTQEDAERLEMAISELRHRVDRLAERGK